MDRGSLLHCTLLYNREDLVPIPTQKPGIACDTVFIYKSGSLLTIQQPRAPRRQLGLPREALHHQQDTQLPGCVYRNSFLQRVPLGSSIFT